MPMSRGGRRVRALVITVVVLLVLLVAADRGGNWFAERKAAEAIQTSQHLNARPDVDIAGFPFLTQLAARKFGRITITAHDVPLERITLGDIQVVLHHVTFSNSFHTVNARTATATAHDSYADLSKALGATVRYTGSGRISATKSITVLGQTISGTVSSTPRLANGALTFGSSAINDANAIAGAAASVLDKVFDLTIPLDGIPFGVRVTGLFADSSGLTLQLTGSDLTYSR